MVDGGWGVLQDPNIIWIGHHLGFRAFGLAAGPDRGRRPSGLRIAHLHRGKLPELHGDSHAIKTKSPHAETCCACGDLVFIAWLSPDLAVNAPRPSRTRSTRRAPIARRSTRRGHQLPKPSDDLSMLCLDLKALPTHHLPWAGFGLGQPHWPMVSAHFY